MNVAAQAELTQLERARLRNRQTWRSTAIGCIVLAVTVVLSPLIPALIVIALIETGQRERAAAAGTYTAKDQRRRAVCAWSGVAMLCGAWLLYWNSDGGAVGGLVVGALALIGGAGVLAWTRRSARAD